MGVAYGLLETANGIPMILAPLLAGWLYQRAPHLVWPLAGGLLLLLLALTTPWLYRTPAFAPQHRPLPLGSD